jgi:hypothetical protein
MRSKKRFAAHFLLIPELLYSPPNEAIVNALIEEGYEVDIYSPYLLPSQTEYGDGVKTFQVNYSWVWIVRNLSKRQWRKYSVYSGTSEDPIAVVGLLSFIYRKPCFALVDEIKSESYSGDRSIYWKRICKWGIRRARFKIVNDTSRVQLLREYVNMKEVGSIIVYPGCYREPEMKSEELRLDIRKKWGFSDTSFVIGSSGGFNMTSGADWLINYMSHDSGMHAVIQPLGVSELAVFLLDKLEFKDRIFVEKKRLSWAEAWRDAQALNVGICIYRNPAPQFQRMGVSSNRLCMFIAMGVPVIASRQDSFRFIEEFNCGRLVSDYDEFCDSVRIVKEEWKTMKDNCRQCFKEYIKTNEAYTILKTRIRKLNPGSQGQINSFGDQI